MKRFWNKKLVLRLLIVVLCLCVTGVGTLLGINAYVRGSVRDRIVSAEDAAALESVDCILVLGCLVKSNGEPSDMLADRLTKGIELYELSAAPRILMSGDHGREEYDEVNAMKDFAVAAGVPASHVFMDHAGFSTYESIYRAKEIFGAKKVVIVTQEYHLYRALYVAEALGLEAYGVPSDYREYRGQWGRELREILARVKDFGTSVLQPEPTYLGEKISLTGDGGVTDDRHIES
ncbi:MAG: YdcF family protein [Clostridia bacterium]|nr:YdcF family protein [Clostridia bacterium]